MIIDLEELQKKVDVWTKYNFPDKKSYQPLLGIVEEVGELSHTHLKMEQGIRQPKQADKEDAIGDIVIYMIDYCNQNNIDFGKAILTTWEYVKDRDWIKHPETGIRQNKIDCPFERIRSYPYCYEDCPDVEQCPSGQYKEVKNE